MGVVYLAERRDLGSLAAIKILRDAWLSAGRRERFAAEQRTLAHLNHPAIAHLHDAGSLKDGTPWIVMEYVEGEPLTEYCRKHRTSIEGRLELVRSVCEAVQYAHGQAVIHRDLKPSNILVKADGTVKLLDFGIARHLEREDGTIDQTRTSLRLMTPAYAAPELIRGERAGIHSDVYALGVIMYELLVGERPFIAEREPERPSIAARRRATIEDPVPSGRGAGHTSWSDLDVLCLTALHNDPARRYRTVDALVRDVDHYLAGEPLEARPDTVGYRLGKFVRRHRAAVAAAMLALTTLAGLVVFYTVRLTQARNAAVAEAARTERIQRFMLNLFEGGDPGVGPADTLRVITLVDRGVQEAQSLGAEPAVQAELYGTLGGIYQKLGQLDRADSLLQASLDRRQSILGATHPDVAASLVALGLLRSDQAKYEEAERLVRDGLELSRRTLAPDHPDTAAATAALGHVLVERGSYGQAIEMLEEAVRLRSAKRAVSAELAATLHELSNAHFYEGHWATAESFSQRSMSMHRELYGDRHPHVADDLVNLGAIQHEQGRYREAEQYYRKALEITRAWYGADHYRTASNLTMVGRTIVFLKRYDEAKVLLEEARAIQEGVFGPDHPRVASAVNDLGSVALRQSAYDQAEAAFRRMAEIYRKAYPGNHYLIGTAVSNLASVYQARSEYPEAERLFRDALGIYRATLPAGHLNIGIAQIKLGRSLLRQKRYAEAEREALAGYNILAKQTSPSVIWLQSAREDLTAIYEALGQPAKAAEFRPPPPSSAPGS
jgi:serine/threonine-protein kinase